MTRRTKIVATIGPASQDEKMIRELLRSGVNVARLNFSHGSHADHAEVLKRLRQIAAELGRPVCVLQDLQGPKIRTGDLPGGKIEIEAGQVLTLTTAPGPYAPGEVPVDFPELPSSVRPGGRILLDDGNLELAVFVTDDAAAELAAFAPSLADLPAPVAHGAAWPGAVEFAEVSVRSTAEGDAISFGITPQILRH